MTLRFDPSSENMAGLYERVSGARVPRDWPKASGTLNRVRSWALKPTWSANARKVIAFVLRDIADAVDEMK